MPAIYRREGPLCKSSKPRFEVERWPVAFNLPTLLQLRKYESIAPLLHYSNNTEPPALRFDSKGPAEIFQAGSL